MAIEKMRAELREENVHIFQVILQGEARRLECGKKAERRMAALLQGLATSLDVSYPDDPAEKSVAMRRVINAAFVSTANTR